MKNIYLIIACALAFTLFSCSSDKKNINITYDAKVYDSLNVLNPNIKNYLENYDFPPNVYPIIHSTDHIQKEYIGIYADEVFDKYVDELKDGKSFKKKGLLIVCTEDPLLIQIRLGSEYRMFCDYRNVSAGPAYLSLQRSIDTIGIDAAVPMFVEHTLNGINEYNGLSDSQKSRLNKAQTYLTTELSNIGTPSDNAYSKFWFRPIVDLTMKGYSFFHSWFVSFLLLALIAFGLSKLLTFWIVKKIDKSNSPPATKILSRIYVPYTGRGICNFLIGFPAVASFAFLANGRLEDQLVLSTANMELLNQFQLMESDYAANAGMILTFGLLLAYYFKKLLSTKNDYLPLSYYPRDTQVQLFERLPKEQQDSYKGMIDLNILGIIITSIFQAMVSDHNSNDGDVENSFLQNSDSALFKNAPFSCYIVNKHIVLYPTLFVLTVLSLYILPYSIVLYLTATWSISAIYRFIVMQKITIRTSKNLAAMAKLSYNKLCIYISITLVICTGIAIWNYYTNPFKERESVTQIEIKSLPIEKVVGEYYLRHYNTNAPDNITYETAKIEQIGNSAEYNLRLYIYGEYENSLYDLFYDPTSLSIKSDGLGEGSISFKKDNELAKITFIKNDEVWELR